MSVVCAEPLNPDEDDEDTEPRVVHPKTDEQRCRLQEACRDILLFKTLDQVNQSHKQTKQNRKRCVHRWLAMDKTIKKKKGGGRKVEQRMIPEGMPSSLNLSVRP